MGVIMNSLEIGFTTLDINLESKYAWFSNSSFNSICKLNLETFNTEIVSVFDNRECSERDIHVKVLRKENRLFFIPKHFECIDVYDVDSQLQEHLYCPNDMKMDVYNAFMIDDKIYIIPYLSTDNSIIYDLKKNAFEKNNKLSEEIKKYKGVISYDSVAEKSGELWIVPFRSSKLIRYNVKNEKIKTYDLDFSDLCSVKAGEYIAISKDRLSEISLFDVKKEKIVKTISPEGLFKDFFSYGLFAPLYFGDKIYYLSKKKTELIIDKQEYIEVPLGEFYGDLRPRPYVRMIEYNDKIVFVPSALGELLVLNTKEMTVMVKKWKCNVLRDYKYDLNKLTKELLCKKILNEGQVLDLDNYIFALLMDK